MDTEPTRGSSGRRVVIVIASVIMCGFCACCALIFGGIGATAGLGALLLSNSATTSDTQTVSLAANDVRSITIDDANIGVTMRGSTEDTDTITFDIEYTANSYSEGTAESALSDITLNIQQDSTNGLTVTLENNAAWYVFAGADLEITVPAEMESVMIDSAETVMISNVTADFDIEVTGGADVTLNNVNGTFNVASTISIGEISFRGNMAPNATHHFETRSGDIDITFLDTPSLAYTVNTGRDQQVANANQFGDVECPDGATVSEFFCSGQLGDGTGQLDVVSRSGDVTITVP